MNKKTNDKISSDYSNKNKESSNVPLFDKSENKQVSISINENQNKINPTKELIAKDIKLDIKRNAIEKLQPETKLREHKQADNIIISTNPKTTFVQAKEEEQNKLKFIGYEPSIKFEQREPFYYPMVFMPNPRSVIKFPRKGKQGLKGYAEDLFKQQILENFKNIFQVYDDRFVLYKSNQNPFEPDFTLIDEKNDLNLFIDIEIDEPYDGISRQPIHYVDFDKHRNSFFQNRGWIVIRFAEYQIFNDALSCCKFIAEVVQSVNQKFIIAAKFKETNNVIPIKQWSREQSIIWANEKYRERYLNIDKFNTRENEIILVNLTETEIGKEVEQHVNEELTDSIEFKKRLIKRAIHCNNFISCRISANYSVIKPTQVDNAILIGFCYLKNLEMSYDINQLNDMILREKPFVFRINGAVGANEIQSFIVKYIGSKNPIRIKYTKSTFGLYKVDRETGEIILSDEERDSLRTITNFDIVSRVYTADEIAQFKLNDDDYIAGFCNKQNALRTFKFDRINELEILNI